MLHRRVFVSLQSIEWVWIAVIATTVLLGLAIGVISLTVQSQRRFAAARKRQWQELQKREEQYRDLFNNVSDIVYIHSPQGEILQYNLAVTKLLGYQPDELVGKSLKEIIVPKHHKQVDRCLERIHQTGGSSGLIYLIDKTGVECLFEYRSSLLSKNGESASVRGIARNVTEQKQTERALQESEERFRRLVEFSPIPIGVHSRGRWVYVNDAGQQLLGAQNQKQIIGKPVLRFVKPERRKAIKERIRGLLLEGKEASRIQEKITRVDGKEIEVEVIAIPIIYDNKPAGEVVVRDITEQKRMQEELARAQRLETAGRVAGQIAHDFNNLLAPLTAYPTLIREDLPEGHEVLELVDEMEAAANKIGEINQQLLTLSRRGHYVTECVHLNDLIDKILRSQHLPEEIAVNLNLAQNLLMIKGGSAQLTRALTNLILNAKEAMHGIGVLTIGTENVYLDQPLRGYQTVKKGEYVRLTITDTGTGIDPEIMNNIFDPFFTTKRMERMRGSGLGLSIVHGIIEDHDGYIIVDSTLGEGTTFSIYFPISRDFENEEFELAELKNGNGEKILVVDDDPVQRSVAGQLLKRLGYRVHQVSSGEEAVNYVRRNPQDLLILDMVMEGIDGVETYRQILEFKSDQKAIMLSGYAISERVEEALSLGAGSFVAKPITPSVLANAIREELDRRNSDHSSS